MKAIQFMKTLGKLRQKNCYEFKTCLSYRVSARLAYAIVRFYQATMINVFGKNEDNYVR